MYVKKHIGLIFYALIVLINVDYANAQSSKDTFKFLDCEWGAKSEQTIASSKKALQTTVGEIDIVEDSNLSKEEKDAGITKFHTDRAKSLQIDTYTWMWVDLKFKNDGLIEVALVGGGETEDSRLENELETKYGSYDDFIPVLTGVKIWKASDGSKLSFNSHTNPVGKLCTLRYEAPAREEGKATNVTETATQTGQKSMQFMNCEWGMSPEMVVKALSESLKVTIVPKPAKKESERELDKLMGITKYGLDNFKFQGYPWTLTIEFYDNKLEQVELKNFKKELIDEADILKQIEAKYCEGKSSSAMLTIYAKARLQGVDVQKPTDFIDMTWSWAGQDGSELSLSHLELVKLVTWSAPGHFERWKQRNDEAQKKIKSKW